MKTKAFSISKGKHLPLTHHIFQPTFITLCATGQSVYYWPAPSTLCAVNLTLRVFPSINWKEQWDEREVKRLRRWSHQDLFLQSFGFSQNALCPLWSSSVHPLSLPVVGWGTLQQQLSHYSLMYSTEPTYSKHEQWRGRLSLCLFSGSSVFFSCCSREFCSFFSLFHSELWAGVVSE